MELGSRWDLQLFQLFLPLSFLPLPGGLLILLSATNLAQFLAWDLLWMPRQPDHYHLSATIEKGMGTPRYLFWRSLL